jgi:hypothetical protein
MRLPGSAEAKASSAVRRYYNRNQVLLGHRNTATDQYVDCEEKSGVFK